ncbi:MAG: hypothetical protein KDB68_11525 [Planctomycetes bacterium]|nr:hypothetical protein [Planctomycetota bacterium]MCA8936820.1 hypothetical protein [Planctomycetota bacterium]MCA8945099.1 hypothetical protein [Planctomycetota bacterium]
MPGIKTNDKVSERLLSIDWGQPSARQRAAKDTAPVRNLKGLEVSVRIDEVFHHINAYRALVEAEVQGEGLLARSLISQANAIFNEAFVNLEKRFGFAKVYVDGPVAGNQRAGEDITDLVIEEVLALQNILDA